MQWNIQSKLNNLNIVMIINNRLQLRYKSNHNMDLGLTKVSLYLEAELNLCAGFSLLQYHLG